MSITKVKVKYILSIVKVNFVAKVLFEPLLGDGPVMVAVLKCAYMQKISIKHLVISKKSSTFAAKLKKRR